MDHGQRAALGGGMGQRPLPPKRAVSGSYAIQQGLKRPAVPSRLNNVRSVSQHGNYVDLTTSDAASSRNAAAFTNNTAARSISNSPNHVIDLSDEDHERPAKRARTGAGDMSPFEPGTSQHVSQQRWPGQPLPLPPTPRVPPTMGKSRRPAIHRLARKANGLEPPPCATRLAPPKQVADFAPWNGQHPEDVMTEGVVKGGYYDKAPGPNSTETNSAKPIIWPNLSAKNNMGLQTLSYLFTSVIEKRQALGKCTAPSTFKPPPRVTVTDTKREAWLRDLANPDVPLRKQSRTIPHGIRGKLLMEQCLSKNIPMPRAVWLAKCVGANELRAFRRKGVSGVAAATGESKWIQEWSVQVEHFLASVIAMCGQPEWQPKMDYAVKLATAFYAERLLDREHYLDWIVSCFARAPMDQLPIWIILVQLYWKDITAFGRRGRQLAAATLESLQKLTQGDHRASNHVLVARLHKLVAVLAVTNRGCLVMPTAWRKYQHLLLSLRNIAPDAAQSITRRNLRLLAPLTKTSQNIRCPLLTLYGILDAHTTLYVDVERLTVACQNVMPDLDRLVAALLHWSASAYRVGESRAYLAAQVIMHLHFHAHDTDSAIMNYLRLTPTPDVVAADVYRVVADLARANCFSCGRYMQWLITSGALAGTETTGLATGLLTALPANITATHLQNTRKSLLQRVPTLRDDGDVVAATLDGVARRDSSSARHVPSEAIESLTATSRYELASSLTRELPSLLSDGSLDVGKFCNIRNALESTGDVRTLSEMLHMTMASNDVAVLASICDTINLHSTSFAAMGALLPMLNLMLDKYATLRSQLPLDRTWILALMALTQPFIDKASTLGRPQILAALPLDLSFCEQQTSLAVCSPASDSMVSMQAAGSLNSDQEIDAVFASGNTMDEQLMQRVFARIVQRAGKEVEGEAEQRTSPKLCVWLSQLHAVDSIAFDALAKSYVQGYLRGSGDITTTYVVISALVASGCVGLDSVVDFAQAIDTSTAASNMIHLLTSKLVASACLREAEAYRFHVMQQRVRTTCASRVISLLISALDDPQFPCEEPGLISLLMEYSASRYHACFQALAGAPSSSAVFLSNCGRVVTNILSVARGLPVADVKLDAPTMVAIADPISVVYCTCALSFLAKVEASSIQDSPDSTLQATIVEAIVNGSEVWPQLLESAGKHTIRSIYCWARDQILSGTSSGGDEISSVDDVQASRNLDILYASHHALQGDDNAHVVHSLTERIKALTERLPKAPLEADHKGDLSMLKLLLDLSVLYTTPDAVAESEDPKSGRDSLLVTLCVLLGHPGLQCHQGLLEYTYDVASALADTLPLEILAALSHTMARNGYRDPRLAVILGSTQSSESWLALVSYPQSQAVGGSAQAKALLQRAAQQQQQQQQQQSINAGRSGAMPSSCGPGALPRTMSMRSGQQAQAQGEAKTVPYVLRRWEVMSDATPSMGDNDTSLSLALFGARKVS